MNTPIVFLHGFPLNGTMWQPQIDYFKKLTTVYAPDLRGHGRGPQSPGPWLIDHYVEDLINMFNANGIESATLCGLSMGGYIAMQFVSEYPQRVHSLVLCDTQAKADSNDSKKQRFSTIQKIQKYGLADYAQNFLTTAFSKTTLQNQPQLVKQMEDTIKENNYANIAMVLGALASRRDYRTILPDIKCPTLVIVGSDDIITPPAANEDIARNVSGSIFKVIPDAGHLSSLEQPQIFNQILDTFLTNSDFKFVEPGPSI